MRVTVSNTVSDVFTPWKLDAKAIQEALVLVGAESITNPIRVKLSSAGKNGKKASIRAITSRKGVKVENPEISVIVGKYATPEDANRSLWHELTHIGQIARLGGLDEFLRQYSQYSSVKASAKWSPRYAANPFEVEANETAESYADVPLVTVDF